MKTNYHTHTQRCLHAGGTEVDYVQAALEAGVSVLGFSDHAPFPDRDYGYRMPFSELETYFSEVDRLSKLHQDVIIKKSLEIEYLPQYRDYYERLIDHYHTDYLLLGEHFFLDQAGAFHNISIHGKGTDAYVDYAKAVAQALHTGYFQMVAHPDIFTMNPNAWDINCERATEIILDAAVQTGSILEFNANGFRRGIHAYPDGERYMYPHTKFWERVVGTNIPVIVGSDCHGPSQVWDEAMARSFEVLKELGIRPCLTLEEAGQQ